MEIALRRRLAGVDDIRISQAQQAAEVWLTPGPTAFAPGEFRAAVAEADVEVLRFEVDVCGFIVPEADATWFVAGANRFVVDGEVAEPPGVLLCLTAALDDGQEPPRLRPVRAGP